jgi:hypothetical protein
MTRDESRKTMAPKGKRQPRPPSHKTKRQAATAQHEIEWEKNRTRRPKRIHVDGRRVAEDLEKLHSLTGDPIFAHACEVLLAYGLADGLPLTSIKPVRLSFPSVDQRDAEEYAEGFECIAEEKRSKFNLTATAEMVVAKCGLPGASFRSAVEEFRKRYAGRKKGSIGAIGSIEAATERQLKVVAVYGDPFLSKPPDANGLIPDDRRSRRALYRGAIAVAFLGKKQG